MGRESSLQRLSKKRDGSKEETNRSIFNTNTRREEQTMPDWLIKIVPVTPANPGDPTAAFSPVHATGPGGRQHHHGRTRRMRVHEVVPVSPTPPVLAGIVRSGSRSRLGVVKPDLLGRRTGQARSGHRTADRRRQGQDDPDLRLAKYQCKLHPEEVGYFDILQNPPTFT